MNWQAITFDWNQVRAFLATAEEGSLSATGRSEFIDGHVSVTATEGFAMQHLPAIVERVRGRGAVHKIERGGVFQ